MRWGAFAEARPDLAAEGRRLLYQFSVGLGMLATVGRDGAPRVHPMCPVLVGDGLYAVIEPGPKRRDLERDGRYALHCHPPAESEDAFYVTGRARAVAADDPLDREVRLAFWAERGKDEPDPRGAAAGIFELDVERCLVTRTTGHGDWEPQHTVWRA